MSSPHCQSSGGNADKFVYRVHNSWHRERVGQIIKSSHPLVGNTPTSLTLWIKPTDQFNPPNFSNLQVYHLSGSTFTNLASVPTITGSNFVETEFTLSNCPTIQANDEIGIRAVGATGSSSSYGLSIEMSNSNPENYSNIVESHDSGVNEYSSYDLKYCVAYSTGSGGSGGSGGSEGSVDLTADGAVIDHVFYLNTVVPK